MPTLSKILIGVGGLLILAGLVWWLFGDKLGFLGRLPGDIRYERDNVRVYIPIATMLLISLLLTLVINIISRWGK